MSGDQLTEADLPALQALARECLDRDGGLPAFADPPMLRARLLREQTMAVREAGRLVAAAGVTVDGATATASGMVAPGVRGRGLGSLLLRWTDDRARRRGADRCDRNARTGRRAAVRAARAGPDLRRGGHAPRPRGGAARAGAERGSGRADDRGRVRRPVHRVRRVLRRAARFRGADAAGSGWASWSRTRTGGATCPRWCWTPPAYRSASSTSSAARGVQGGSSPLARNHGSTRSACCRPGAAAAWARTWCRGRCGP